MYTDIDQLSGDVDAQSQEFIDRWEPWPTDYGPVYPILDVEGHNVYPGGCGIVFDFQIVSHEWGAPNKIYGCISGDHGSYRIDNMSNENDVRRTNSPYSHFYWHYSDPQDIYSKLMVRASAGHYRIFAEFEGHFGFGDAPGPYTRKLFQADIMADGSVNMISYDDAEFPEYQAGDMIVYDKGQGIDADEGMFPQPWMEILEVRQAYNAAIAAKVSDVWPGEEYAEWAGVCRLMPRIEPSESSESSSSET